MSETDAPKPHLNWIKWWPRDFTASTLGWPADAVGAYIRLLHASWDQHGLRDEKNSLQEIAGVRGKRWRLLWSEYLSENFFTGPDGRLRNPRLEKARSEALKTSEAARAKAHRRWGTVS